MKEITILCLGTRLDGNKRVTLVSFGGELVTFDFNKRMMVNAYYKVLARIVDGKLTSYNPNSASLERLVNNPANAVSHNSAETLYIAINKAKKDKSGLLDLLKPLRQQYAKTNHAGKLALEVRILNYIRYGKDL